MTPGNSDDVDQAHQDLKTLIFRIALTSNDDALHGMLARMDRDFANLLPGACRGIGPGTNPRQRLDRGVTFTAKNGPA